MTPAAGWNILNCDANGTAQDIRAACNSTDADSPCNHLFQGGAVGTIVRLPENCTEMPFARIAAAWDEVNSSALARRHPRMFGRQAEPVVKGFSLDSNFSAVDPAQNGNVMFWIQSSSTPAASPSTSTSDLNQRSLLGSIGQAITSATTISKNVTENAAPISVNQNGVLFNESIACPAIGDIPPFTADVVVSMDAQATAMLSYGIAVSGSLVPPALNEFELFANLNGSIDGTLTVNASASTTLSTGLIPLFTVPIGGLDIPGILTIGPTFTLNAEATAMLDVDLNMVVGLNHTINNAELIFPPSSNSSSGGIFAPGDTNLQLSATPNVTSNTNLTAHLIPEIAFGINALSGVAQATVNLELDASVTLGLDLQAEASTATNASLGATSAFGGSVNVEAALDVTAGADASFLTFFDEGTMVTLFQKTFELFQENFVSPAAKRRARRARRHVRRNVLTCPVVALQTIESIVQIEKAAAALEAA